MSGFQSFIIEHSVTIAIVSTSLLLLLSLYTLRLNHLYRRKTRRLRNRVEAAKVAAKRIKGLFFANISHEIRTPLNGILGYAQLLHRDDRLDEKQQEQLSHIIDSSGQLAELINDLLEISSIASDSVILQNKNFDLSEMLQGIAAIFEVRALEKGIVFQFYHCSPIAMPVYADQGKLRQVLVKLVGNAVKFTHQGQVDLRVEQTEGGCRFSIRDTGPGMSVHQQKVIFNPFEHRRKQTGIGISLAIVKHHVELMGGMLSIESTLGEGSSFNFELPLDQAHAPVNARQLRCHKVKRLQQSFLNPHDPVRIMVVDENPQTRQVLLAMLADIGIAVIAADDGRSALDILRQLPKAYMPSLVIYDISVPLHTDARRLARIYHQYAPEGMQFIVLAASAVQVEIQQYLTLKGQNAAFENFVAKPYRFEAIYQMIHQLLQVDFDYYEPIEKVQSMAKPNPADCILSHDVLQTLTSAAKDYEVSKLESLLTQLCEDSPRQKSFCEHLHSFISHYDMEGLLNELGKVQVCDQQSIS